MESPSPPQASPSDADTGLGDAEDGGLLGFESEDEDPWADEPNFGFDPPPALSFEPLSHQSFSQS